MYDVQLDDRGRIKMPTAFQQYFKTLAENRFFVTSLDRSIGQIYPISVWKENEKFFADYRGNPSVSRDVAFNAADLGDEADIDGQGRILFPTKLRKELGIENQVVHLFTYRRRIEVLSEKIYEERKRQATTHATENVAALEAAGLN